MPAAWPSPCAIDPRQCVWRDVQHCSFVVWLTREAMHLLSALRSQANLLAFGVLMMFCSSFGQTYFVALFGGAIRADFGLGHGAYGSYYAIGTAASATVLIWAGRAIDRVSLTAFSVASMAGLALATLLMSSVSGVVGLAAAFFALRLFGQGLTTHAAMTAMGRYFTTMRGRAVSIASLGHILAQACLPPLLVMLMVAVPWRTIWIMGALALLLAGIPLIVILLRRAALQTPGESVQGRRHVSPSQPRPNQGDYTRVGDRTLAQVLRDPGLYLRLPVLLAPAYISTGLVFHQVHVGASKGWSLGLLAGSFSALALGSFLMTLVAGPLVDRFTARRLVPICLAPLALSCVALAISDATVVAPLFFGLLGAGGSLTLVIKGAVWPEIYGTTHLGTIRAFTTALMVYSSGLAPAMMGLFFDWDVSPEAVAAGCAVYCVGASALSLFAGPGLAPDVTTTDAPDATASRHAP